MQDPHRDSCGCRPGMDRRTFVKLAGLGAAAYMAGSPRVMAGPFETADFARLIPPDKKLHPDWVKSLFERGEPLVWHGADLKYVGMPVGGLCAGQLYLSGDGRLWYWDIFNAYIFSGFAAPTYADPRLPVSVLQQGFTLTASADGESRDWPLDQTGFPDVAFNGEYPFGFVEYRRSDCPVQVSLEAFSPFTPLCAADSSLPATVMRYTLRNTGTKPVDLELTGHLENGAGTVSQYVYGAKGTRRNHIVRDGSTLALQCSIEAAPASSLPNPPRPVIVFADFEGPTYGAWTTEGDAFGAGPTSQGPQVRQRVTDYEGKSFADSFTQASGDLPQGKLISPDFTVERAYINFLLGGGNIPLKTCINLVVAGVMVRTTSRVMVGENMEWHGWDVSEYEGQKAHIEIVDHSSVPWGHVEVDQIQFEDVPKLPAYGPDMFDFGTMSLSLLDAGPADSGKADLRSGVQSADWPANAANHATGSVTRKVTLQPGESHTANFVIAWHFPYLGHGRQLGAFSNQEGRYYATQFTDAADVTRHLAGQFDRLYSQTRAWHDTWYDSTLPYWFLTRTHHNVSTLASSTAYRYANGNFYGWEGVGCCGGTCTHVWSYEQAMGRLFPEYDRILRQRIDYNLHAALGGDGHIANRGNGTAATDGQAGTILRTYRDHQTSPDNQFLESIWPQVKLALGWLIKADGNNDGLIEGPQPNTMDETWYGAVPWMSGMYLAALRAGEEMARDLGDHDFANQCRAIFEVGRRKFLSVLWNEQAQYFFQTHNPDHYDVRGSYDGCEVDQVYGQSWGWQVGLGRVLPERQTRLALASIWKYNFAPDVGPFTERYGTANYAAPGEAGLYICTWPQVAGPLKECNYWNLIFAGIEHHVAGHMIWEGMLLEGFAVERAVHDRYHPAKRNPFNEVECGDHYARSMASYGVFIAACGFEYHGPRGTMAFAPRLRPEDFRSAFTASEGWGTYAQRQHAGAFHASLELKWGSLALNSLTLSPPNSGAGASVTASLDGRNLPLKARHHDGRVTLEFARPVELAIARKLSVVIA